MEHDYRPLQDRFDFVATPRVFERLMERFPKQRDRAAHLRVYLDEGPAPNDLTALQVPDGHNVRYSHTANEAPVWTLGKCRVDLSHRTEAAHALSVRVGKKFLDIPARSARARSEYALLLCVSGMLADGLLTHDDLIADGYVTDAARTQEKLPVEPESSVPLKIEERGVIAVERIAEALESIAEHLAALFSDSDTD